MRVGNEVVGGWEGGLKRPRKCRRSDSEDRRCSFNGKQYTRVREDRSIIPAREIGQGIEIVSGTKHSH